MWMNVSPLTAAVAKREKDALEAALNGAREERAEVGPGRYCSPRHPTHFEPLSLEIDGNYGVRVKAWCVLLHEEAPPSRTLLHGTL